MYRAAVLLALVLCAPVPFTPPARAQQEAAQQTQEDVGQSMEVRRRTQRELDEWVEARAALEAEYDRLHEGVQHLEKELERLSVEKNQTHSRIAALRDKLQRIESVSTAMLPYLHDVVERVERMMTAGLPIDLPQRRDSLAQLGRTMSEPQTGVGEKFRAVMQVLFDEAAYGMSVDTAQDMVVLDGREKLVTVLRVGRLSLFCETLDETTTGVYDPASGAWQVLPDSDNHLIDAAIDMADKQRPVSIVALPLGRIAVPAPDESR